MIFYKQINENTIVSIGSTSAKLLPNGFEEITEAEYNEIMADIMANAPAEPEPDADDISDYENGFEEGYMQALLDLMELESGEE